ncbi:hypothetical protein [Streptomyces sp. NPDC058424]|uniref:hypothetical protein n=1 Tax=Streptomyces sp. NPDC058424 TaxID=3346491 RepID=UPI003657533E
MQSISVLSTEYVRVGVRATVNGGPYNPTPGAVQFAFTRGTAAPETWVDGEWDETPLPGTTTYVARCLIGPDTVALTPGTYNVWIKITADLETPVRKTGQLQIT